MFSRGSGDTTFNYVQLLCFAVFAAVGTLVWSTLDARRTQYAKLHDWLRICVRYFLAVHMIAYGMTKVIKTQFPFPGPVASLRPLGSDRMPIRTYVPAVGPSSNFLGFPNFFLVLC